MTAAGIAKTRRSARRRRKCALKRLENAKTVTKRRKENEEHEICKVGKGLGLAQRKVLRGRARAEIRVRVEVSKCRDKGGGRRERLKTKRTEIRGARGREGAERER